MSAIHVVAYIHTVYIVAIISTINALLSMVSSSEILRVTINATKKECGKKPAPMLWFGNI